MGTNNQISINHLSNVNHLCRVCLTESKKMIPLINNFVRKNGKGCTTIWQVLSEISGIKIPSDERYPSYICPMCMSLLKVLYKFKMQFENSQELLSSYFGESLLTNNFNQLIGLAEEDSTTAQVELIFKQGKYDLRDVFVIEQEEEEQAAKFTGFLKNLGKEVSASFVNSNATISQANINNFDLTNINSKSLDLPIDTVTGVDECAREESNLQSKTIPTVLDDVGLSDRKINDFYVCSFCQKNFTKKKNLSYHIKSVHYNKTDTFVCEVCGAIKQSRSSHYHHMMKHHGRKYSCTTCDKSYFSSAALQQHVVAVHKNARTQLCTICGKTFNYANALTYHMRIHTDERKYKCTYCDRTFRIQCGLNRHLRVHTGIRPYKCSYCEKSFRSKGEVDCHEMIHTGYRPYHCKYCNKGFTKTYNLRLHLLGHKGDHVCEICNKTFIEVEFLKFHMQSIHFGKESNEENKVEICVT